MVFQFALCLMSPESVRQSGANREWFDVFPAPEGNLAPVCYGSANES